MLNYEYDTRGNRARVNTTAGLGLDLKTKTGVTNYIYDQNNRLIKDTTIKGGDI